MCYSKNSNIIKNSTTPPPDFLWKESRHLEIKHGDWTLLLYYFLNYFFLPFLPNIYFPPIENISCLYQLKSKIFICFQSEIVLFLDEVNPLQAKFPCGLQESIVKEFTVDIRLATWSVCEKVQSDFQIGQVSGKFALWAVRK